MGGKLDTAFVVSAILGKNDLSREVADSQSSKPNGCILGFVESSFKTALEHSSFNIVLPDNSPDGLTILY